MKFFKNPIIIGIIFFIGGFIYWHFNYSPIAFNPEIWKQGEYAEFSTKAPRLRMADGLVHSGILLNKTVDEIVEMLGLPSETEYFQNYNMVYWLGAERGLFSIDSEWLVIRLNSLGKAEEIRIVGD